MMKNIPIRSGEMVCIELVALSKSDYRETVLFSGSVDYETIRYIHEVTVNLR